MSEGDIWRRYGHDSGIDEAMCLTSDSDLAACGTGNSVDNPVSAPLEWLRELDLSNNHLSSRAATILVDSIVNSTNTALTRLDLSHNELTSNCCDAIAALIRHEYKPCTDAAQSVSAVHRGSGFTSPGLSAGNDVGGRCVRGLSVLDLSWNMLKACEVNLLF